MAGSVRPAAVAGTFYPGEAETLRSSIVAMLREAGAPPEGARVPKAVIAPHAGYVFSGALAARAFQALAPARGRLRRIVLLGPAHYVPIRGLALPGDSRFATPLGELEVDGEGAGQALRLPQVRLMPEAHAREHSLEVELPFLQVMFGEVTVVPLVVGEASGEEVAEVLERLWGGEETAIVISSDLSHFLPYDTARAVDRETAEEILSLRGPLEPRQACGAAPINGLLETARRRGLAPELLDLRNSGDTAGDRSRVVGYGAFSFHETRHEKD